MSLSSLPPFSLSLHKGQRYGLSQLANMMSTQTKQGLLVIINGESPHGDNSEDLVIDTAQNLLTTLMDYPCQWNRARVFVSNTRNEPHQFYFERSRSDNYPPESTSLDLFNVPKIKVLEFLKDHADIHQVETDDQLTNFYDQDAEMFEYVENNQPAGYEQMITSVYDIFDLSREAYEKLYQMWQQHREKN